MDYHSTNVLVIPKEGSEKCKFLLKKKFRVANKLFARFHEKQILNFSGFFLTPIFQNVLNKEKVARWKKLLESILSSHHAVGPPLTQNSLTRFPLPRFLAYVHASGGFGVSRGPMKISAFYLDKQKSFIPKKIEV